MKAPSPPRTSTVLLLIDVINDLDFPKGGLLLKNALPAAKNILRLKTRAARRGIPTVYVNDNFGRWRSDFRSQVAHCLEKGCLGREIVRLLTPADDDYFVLKPKHSGFYSTSLEVLLEHLRARTVILTGFAGDICVLYTANDAHMRDYRMIVPEDCVASETRAANRRAIDHMKVRLRARITTAARLRLP